MGYRLDFGIRLIYNFCWRPDDQRGKIQLLKPSSQRHSGDVGSFLSFFVIHWPVIPIWYNLFKMLPTNVFVATRLLIPIWYNNPMLTVPVTLVATRLLIPIWYNYFGWIKRFVQVATRLLIPIWYNTAELGALQRTVATRLLIPIWYNIYTPTICTLRLRLDF